MSGVLNEDILKDYVNTICKHSRIASNALKIYLSSAEKPGRPEKELGVIEYAEVLLEFVTFFLHFTDRCLFWEGVAEDRIDVELRDDLMN